jgi:hypothetical protein
MLQVIIERDRIRIGERFAVSFQRTLRIPDDGRTYPLPPGLGRFPIHRVDEVAAGLPGSWRPGGVFLPVHRREALWLAFEAAYWKPSAVKIGVGGINALTGRAWDEDLHDDPQDYLVCPEQPWLDGINVGPGRIRQFVALPLGSGATVEGQITGEERRGGLQVVAYDPRPGLFPDRPPPPGPEGLMESAPARSTAMGLGAGGRMRQKLYPDPYGIETWDPGRRGSIVVHLILAEDYRALTGLEPPPTPIDAQAYIRHGLPWFELDDRARGDLPAPDALSRVRSVGDIDADAGRPPEPPDAPVEVPPDPVEQDEVGRPGPVQDDRASS